jgi:DNA-binding response OmpR family regulator
LIVVVEDDVNIASLVSAYLTKAGFRVQTVSSGEAALSESLVQKASLYVLDISLEGDLDGFQVLRQLRARSATPVLILSARHEELDKLLGLELGADDYVTKPFSPRELVARMRAIMRRAKEPPQEEGVLEVGQIRIDAASRQVWVGQELVPLTMKEYDLLHFLATNKGVALSRQKILANVWGPEWVGDDRTVDVHVRQLRKKLGPALKLTTVWGVGYRLEDD